MSAQITQPHINEERMEAFLGQIVNDVGGGFSSVLAYTGDRLGLFQAMSDGQPVTSQSLAARTGLTERYLREWLLHMAAAGYISYAGNSNYRMQAEQAVALTDETSPFYVGAMFQIFSAMARAEPKIREAFRTGEGMCWGEHHPDLFEGTERFFRPGYAAHLVSDWIPALDGVQEKLERGAVVADVGCGHGASTIILAEAFPNSKFYGFDNHSPSIDHANGHAREHRLTDRLEFHVADCADFADNQYDFIAFFDCFHDLAHPEASAERAAKTLKPDGTVMIVEPMAGENIEDNLNPVGRVYTAASVLCCTPNAISGGGSGLGTVASDSVLASACRAGGLTRFRRAAETPFNRVLEARKG